MRRYLSLLFFILAICVALPAQASSKAASVQDRQSAMAALEAAIVQGPAVIDLHQQATLNLPAGYIFMPSPQVNYLLEAQGNELDDGFVGMIAPANNDDWAVMVTYLPDGYVSDADAAKLNPDQLLKDLRAGAAQNAAHRHSMGQPGLNVVGWVNAPAYDTQTHKLTWTLEGSVENDEASEHFANYNMKVLGREGLFSVTLASSASAIATYKPMADSLLANIQFNPGKRYADFNASTDKVATYGLAALVTGVVAKKAGVLAVIGLALAKGAKLIMIAVLGGLAALKNMLTGRRKKGEAVNTTNQPPPAA